jgi:hypothetical protein
MVQGTWYKVHDTEHALAISIPQKGRDEPRDIYAVSRDDHSPRYRHSTRYRHSADMGPVPVTDTAPTWGQSRLQTQRPHGASPGYRHSAHMRPVPVTDTESAEADMPAHCALPRSNSSPSLQQVQAQRQSS